VVVAGGERVRYDDLLIATGARPRTLPLLSRFANVQALRTRDDAERLRAALAAGGPLAVVGAGLIGLEVAATATAAGIPVTVVEAAARPLTGVLGPATALWLAARHVAAGADLRLGVTVAGTIGRDTVTALVLSDGTRVSCAHGLVGIGVAPALDWVAGSGLDPRGVATDPQGRTALPHVFAAGDAAGGGHWEAAAHAGSAVAGALMGHPARRARPASFWTDQHGTRLVCIGDPRDARERHAPPHRAPFALDHLRDGRLVAVVLADPTPAALRDARRRLSTPIPATARTAA
jgi:NADPH-dependent 2,4-dienoyl-CoA reductase/sulfur reductase-like enzyme